MKRKNLTFSTKYRTIGSWSESHEHSGNATDKRIFCTSFTGGSQNTQYAARSLCSAFSATSGLSEKGRKLEKKEHRMKNENTAKSAEKFPYINLNQSVPAVIYDFYPRQLWRHITYSTPWLSPEFPNDDARANLHALGAFDPELLDDSGRIAYQISTQILQR